jgi:hypothetical protein
MTLDQQRSARVEIVGLIGALGRGDAEHGDVLATLRDVGVDSLEALVDALADASRRAPRDHVPQWVDPQSPTRETPPELRAKIVHPVPKLPFVLRGTLYDPADISRFDGQELHFVLGRTPDVITAIDDGETMTRLWQASLLVSADIYLKAKPSGVGVIATGLDPADIVVNPGGGSAPPGGQPPGPIVDLSPWAHPGSAPPPEPHAEFHEHMNFQGDNFELKPGRAQHDLTDYGMSWFWDGDWNDKISSVRLKAGAWAVLWEHVNYAGSSLTVQNDVGYLDALGWNDRASSCAAH